MNNGPGFLYEAATIREVNNVYLYKFFIKQNKKYKSNLPNDLMGLSHENEKLSYILMSVEQYNELYVRVSILQEIKQFYL